MEIFTLSNILFGGAAAMICAYAAKKKGKRTRLALLLGFLFGMFAIIYYLFCKSNTKDWKIKYSWYFLAMYLVALIIFFLGKILAILYSF